MLVPFQQLVVHEARQRYLYPVHTEHVTALNVVS